MNFKKYFNQSAFLTPVILIAGLASAQSGGATSGMASGSMTSASSIPIPSINTNVLSNMDSSSTAGGAIVTPNSNPTSNAISSSATGGTTPIQNQGGQAVGTVDTQLTRRIMNETVKDRTLSDYARNNFRVYTADGQIYLRGNVQNAAERERLAAIVRQSAGSGMTLNNELQISKDPKAAAR